MNGIAAGKGNDMFVYLNGNIVTNFVIYVILQQLLLHSASTDTWTQLLEQNNSISSVDYVFYANSLLFIYSYLSSENFVSKDYGTTFEIARGLNGYVNYANDMFISVGFLGIF